MADTQYKVRSGPNGPIYFPSDMSDSAIDKLMKDQAGTISKLPSLRGTGGAGGTGESTSGKIPPVTPTAQQPPGWPRTANIAAGQFVRGMASPLALPGDVINIVRQAAAMPPEMWPNFRAPDSRSLDNYFTNTLGWTPQSLTPQTWGERELAGAARGAGEGVTAFLPGAVGRVFSRVPYVRDVPGVDWASRYGNLPTNIATGTVAGAASTAAEQQLAPAQDPNRSSTLAPLVPPAVGAAAGLVTGGGIQGAVNAYRAFRGTSPLHGVVSSLGGDMAAGTPYITPTVTNLQNEIRAGGLAASGLDRPTWNALIGTKAKPANPTSLYSSITDANDPTVAVTLGKSYPDEMGDLGGALLANRNTRGTWPGLHDDTKAALVQDPKQLNTVNQSFAGGVVPGGTIGQHLQNLRDAIITRGVQSEAYSGIGALIGSLAATDPQLAHGLALLGATTPYLVRAAKSVFTNPTSRQGALGAAVGLDAGNALVPPVSFSAPGQPSQPPGQDYTPPQP